MRLSKTSEYALRILIYMAQSSDLLFTAKQLVKELKISDKYLRRLMTDLSKSGFIRSIQGREGGYVFIKSPKEIFLYEIIDSVEGMEKLSGCILGFEMCSCINPCAMHNTWQYIRNDLNKVFQETKLSDMDFDKIKRY